jgi:hypothetical protein
MDVHMSPYSRSGTRRCNSSMVAMQEQNVVTKTMTNTAALPSEGSDTLTECIGSCIVGRWNWIKLSKFLACPSQKRIYCLDSALLHRFYSVEVSLSLVAHLAVVRPTKIRDRPVFDSRWDQSFCF